VRSLWDPGPHNTVVRDDGSIQLIDPPGFVRFVAPERDLGVLAYHFTWSARLGGLDVAAESLVDAAVVGYDAELGRDRLHVDRRRVDHELARATFARLRARTRKLATRQLPLARARPLDMARQAGWAIRADVRARRVPPRPHDGPSTDDVGDRTKR
jgi:hypothetical protein